MPNYVAITLFLRQVECIYTYICVCNKVQFKTTLSVHEVSTGEDVFHKPVYWPSAFVSILFSVFCLGFVVVDAGVSPCSEPSSTSQQVML